MCSPPPTPPRQCCGAGSPPPLYPHLPPLSILWPQTISPGPPSRGRLGRVSCFCSSPVTGPARTSFFFSVVPIFDGVHMAGRRSRQSSGSKEPPGYTAGIDIAEGDASAPDDEGATSADDEPPARRGRRRVWSRELMRPRRGATTGTVAGALVTGPAAGGAEAPASSATIGGLGAGCSRAHALSAADCATALATEPSPASK